MTLQAFVFHKRLSFNCLQSSSLSGRVGSQALAWVEASSHALFASTVDILLSRQKKAELLKKMTDVAVRMSEEQLVELRADIKVRLAPPFSPY